MLCQSEDLSSNLHGPCKKPGVTALFFNPNTGGWESETGRLWEFAFDQPGFNSALPASCPEEERLTATEEKT